MKALYREYRPKTFDEVYDQDNIVKVLKNQLKNNRISHAYIFSGSRGTGKTSCAKIFARAINCLNPQDGNPCNECENCKSILEETTVDVVEMDAASNRRIDDIRDLRDKVVYPPTNLKYKVYIIDEAHMITNEAFNALLKTMEEPPKHMVLIFATTEIDKIPQTILSRAQIFEFKKISNEAIKANLKRIINDLGLTYEEEALDLIRESSDGAMRDAVSLLDQSIIDKEVNIENVTSMIGGISSLELESVVYKILNNDYTVLADLINYNLDYLAIIKELTDIYRYAMFIKSGLKNQIRGVSSKKIEKIEKLFSNIDLNRIIDSLGILVEYETLIRKSDNQGALLEILIIKLINYVDEKSFDSRINALERRLSDLEKNGLKINNNSDIKKVPKDTAITNISREEVIENKKKREKEKRETLEKTRENKDNSKEEKEESIDKKEDKKEIIDIEEKNKKEKDNNIENSLRKKYEDNLDKIRELSSQINFSYDQNLISNSKVYFLRESIYFIFDDDAPLYYRIVKSREKELKEIFENVLGNNVEIHISNEKDQLIAELEKSKAKDNKENSKKKDDDLEKIKKYFGDEKLEII